MNDKTINHSANFVNSIDSYIAVSLKRGLTPLCPFASVHRCPRYYLSLSLLSHAGNTSIDPQQDKELEKKWKKSDFWPVTLEQTPSLFGDKSKVHYKNFCPEVSFDKHGLFASGLYPYEDEADIAFAHSELKKETALKADWRWYWSTVVPMHYVECPLFSLLKGNNKQPSKPN